MSHAQHVYDKAEYHFETLERLGLTQSHASYHALPMLRWLIENDLMSEFFVSSCSDGLEAYRRGQTSLYDLYEWWDNCLVGELLSDEGNAFALSYFDFSKGKYMADYAELLQGDLPSEYHVKYDESNYAVLKTRIDHRYLQWKKSQKSWWRFW